MYKRKTRNTKGFKRVVLTLMILILPWFQGMFGGGLEFESTQVDKTFWQRVLTPYILTIQAEEGSFESLDLDEPLDLERPLNPYIQELVPGSEIIHYDESAKQKQWDELQQYIEQIRQISDVEQELANIDRQITQLEQKLEQLSKYTIRDPQYINGKKATYSGITQHMSDGAIDLAGRLPVTVFGDSLVAGSQNEYKAIFPQANIIGVGSMQIGPEGLNLFRQLLQDNNVAPTIIVVLGTNRGLTYGEMDEFMKMAGDRNVFFVNTISHVGHRDSVANVIHNVSFQYENAYEVDFLRYSQGHTATYLDSDNIHHSPRGKQAMAGLSAETIFQILYPKP